MQSVVGCIAEKVSSRLRLFCGEGVALGCGAEREQRPSLADFTVLVERALRRARRGGGPAQSGARCHGNCHRQPENCKNVAVPGSPRAAADEWSGAGQTRPRSFHFLRMFLDLALCLSESFLGTCLTDCDLHKEIVEAPANEDVCLGGGQRARPADVDHPIRERSGRDTD